MTVAATAVVLTGMAASAVAPPGSIDVYTPRPGSTVRAGETILVTGRVSDYNAMPVANTTVSASLRRGDTIRGTLRTDVTGPDGRFSISVPVPTALEGGGYSLWVETNDWNCGNQLVVISIESPAPPPATPAGWPLWAWGLLALSSLAVALILGVALYVRFFRSRR